MTGVQTCALPIFAVFEVTAAAGPGAGCGAAFRQGRGAQTFVEAGDVAKTVPTVPNFFLRGALIVMVCSKSAMMAACCYEAKMAFQI